MKFLLLLLYSGIVAVANGSVLDLLLPYKWTELMYFSEKVGQSLEQLEVGIERIVEEVSRLRGAPGTLENVFVAQNAVLKIRFPDGEPLAVKWRSPAGNFDDMVIGIIALIMVEQCCPNIPINKVEGWSIDGDSIFYFTEWAEGETLGDLLASRIFAENASESEEGFGVPPKIISSLAEFVFNLSMCEIPWTERIYP
jgi:hypothetical protein